MSHNRIVEEENLIDPGLLRLSRNEEESTSSNVPILTRLISHASNTLGGLRSINSSRDLRGIIRTSLIENNDSSQSGLIQSEVELSSGIDRIMNNPSENMEIAGDRQPFIGRLTPHIRQSHQSFLYERQGQRISPITLPQISTVENYSDSRVLPHMSLQPLPSSSSSLRRPRSDSESLSSFINISSYRELRGDNVDDREIDHSSHQRFPSPRLCESLEIYKNLKKFLQKRQTEVKNHESKIQERRNHPEKRKFNNLIGDFQEKILDKEFRKKLRITRILPCSFFSSTSTFIHIPIKEDEESVIPSFRLSMFHLDYQNRKGSGFLNFEDNSQLIMFLSKVVLKINESKFTDEPLRDSISFNMELIDFENNDLRYSSTSNMKLLELVEHQPHNHDWAINNFFHNNYYPEFMELSEEMDDSRLSKDSRNFFKNVRNIKGQLKTWLKLKLFHKISFDQFLRTVMCDDCIYKIQENFIVFKIQLQFDQNSFYGSNFRVSDLNSKTHLLGYIDRKFGDFELVNANFNLFCSTSIEDDTEDDSIMKLTSENYGDGYYSSNTVQLQ
ncbi:hypothetical protein WICMUC_002176 [Wickerhamomyces mucosus]|uniref:Uncharacterized protein n=1 Tax=Wickerhamomyces mucosus TaxID=1378264 RepID=A0A9P8PRU0_9ASCO|nr:hypothetical protein WICMUC_002176 [Wickerhamomyces mucosus]